MAYQGISAFIPLLFYLFLYGCAGSLLLCGLSLAVASRGYSLVWCAGFSLWWVGSLVADHRLKSSSLVLFLGSFLGYFLAALGLSLVAAHELLNVLASLVECGLQGRVGFSSCGACLRYPPKYGIFLHQELNPYLLHWLVDS